MNVQRKSFKKPLLATGIIVALLLSLAGVMYALNVGPFDDASDEQSINLDEPTEEQIELGNEAKEESIREDEVTKDDTGEDTTTPLDNTGSDNSLQTVITALSSDDENLYVRSETQGIYQNGTCEITIRNGSDTYTNKADVQALPQSTTCKGFNIPLSELSSGTWQVELIVKASGKTSTTNDEVTI